jgi:hypothetical protein
MDNQTVDELSLAPEDMAPLDTSQAVSEMMLAAGRAVLALNATAAPGAGELSDATLAALYRAMRATEQAPAAGSEGTAPLAHEGSVLPAVRARAERIVSRLDYAVSGYVLSHLYAERKAIVDTTGVRWMPTSDLTRVMCWKDPVGPRPSQPGSDTEAAGAAASGSESVLAAPLTAPKKAIAVPPSHPMLEDVGVALGELARQLGCIYNESIPHNAGWFVAGMAKAHMSPIDGIVALFGSLKNGGTIYRPAESHCGTCTCHEAQTGGATKKRGSASQVSDQPATQAGLF